MASPRPLLMLALLAWVVLADQESCKGRCTEGFNADRKCQCDELCSYYQSCCSDYVVECKPQVTRGDVFTLPEDEYSFHDYREETRSNTSVQAQPEGSTQTFVQWVQPEETPGQAPVLNPEEETPGPGWGNSEPEVGPLSPETGNLGISESPAEEEQCSGKPFDAFTDLKNGSLFAFRGDSGAGLKKAVRPGYPKLIRDGKTYLFKGSQYWRFEDGVPDPDFPRNISEGFKGIPDNVDAALALPLIATVAGILVFFKLHWRQYWEYEFQQQPSQEECEGSSQSAVFEHFALMQRDSWEDIFRLLFWAPRFSSARTGWFARTVDAAMAGHIYISGSAPRPSRTKMTKSMRRNRKRYRSRRGRGRSRSRSRSQNPYRQSRSTWLSWFSSEEIGLGDYNYDNYKMDWLVPANCEPIQSVYFFSGDKYYRVNLRTRRVDAVIPPYPRSIAQYWLGCPVPAHE
uniref:Vitronectin n=1 Tax=Balaenoptera musculus TaxID=9771 RepID=A0A8C0DX00_BALMU